MMKKYLLTVFLFFFPSLLYTQVHNRGAHIHVGEGTVVRTDLDLVNDQEGVWWNEGLLYTSASFFNTPGSRLMGDGLYEVGEDWRDEGVFLPGASRIRFVGPAASRLYSATESLFDLHLAKTGGGGVYLESRLQLNGDLIFDGSENYLTLGENTLSLGGQTDILGYNAQNHVVTDASGRIALPADPSLTVPVGYDRQSYNPMTISGTAAALQVRCLEHALLDGLTGTLMPHAVDAAWEIFSPTDDLAEYDLVLHWAEADEGADFDRRNSGVAFYTVDGWHLPSGRLAPAGANGLFSRVWAGITDWGLFAVLDVEWVGLDELPLADRILVYPVPANIGIWVETERDYSGYLLLVDNGGREVLRAKASGRKFYLAFPPAISPGVYYLRLVDERGRSFARKIVVE